MRINWKIAFGYAYVHFAMEVLCFFFLYRVFSVGSVLNWWTVAFLYDTLAFVPQSIVGSVVEKYPRFSPGKFGSVLLILGAALGIFASHGFYAPYSPEMSTATGMPAVLTAFAGLVILSAGNAFLHIAGAFATLRASEGRMSESGIFVGAGAFGVITGRLLGQGTGRVWVPFLLMAVAFAAVCLIDAGADKASYDERPCLHDTAADRPVAVIVAVLAAVVAVRSYVSNGIPTDWNKTKVQLVMLFVAMGLGKMAGGVIADMVGAKLAGVVSCLLAIPFLLAGADIMWVSLIGIALFSMTMAIALGGMVSVMRRNPGTAFGVTTFALFFGTLPVAFFGVPGRSTCTVLIIVMSLASAAGLMFTLKGPERVKNKQAE